MQSSPFMRGVSSLTQLRNGGSFVVDKSFYVQDLFTAGAHLTLLYPPRFGKSMTLSAVDVWYNLQTTPEVFNLCFPGSSPAPPLARSFPILRLDLSVDTTGGEQGIRFGVYRKIISSLTLFCRTYGVSVNGPSSVEGAPDYLWRVADAVAHSSNNLMLVLIDEYDRYYNKTLLEDGGQISAVFGDGADGADGADGEDGEDDEGGEGGTSGTSGTSGRGRKGRERREGGKGGKGGKDVKGGEGGEGAQSKQKTLVAPLRTLYETLKDIAGWNRWTHFRSITAGVSPLALAEASGWNIASLVSKNKLFAGLMGFNERDIMAGLELIKHIEPVDRLHFLNIFRRFFNGYRFHPEAESVYNPTLCVSLLWELSMDPDLCSQLKEHREQDDLCVLGILDDPNVGASSAVLSTLGAMGGGAAMAVWDVFNIRDGQQLKVPSADLYAPVRLRDVVMPDRSATTAAEVRTKSLIMLVHHGILTLCPGSGRQEMFSLTVPNLIVRLRQVNRLMALLRVAGNDVVRTALLHPSADGLQVLVSGFLRDPAMGARVVLHRDFSEATFQMTLVRSLELLVRFLPVHGVLVNSEVRVELPHGAPGFCDVVVRHVADGLTIVLELKCIRVTSIDYRDKDLQEMASFARGNQDGLFAFFDQLQLHDLQALSIQPADRRYYKYAHTVEDVLKQAAGQVREYVASLNKMAELETGGQGTAQSGAISRVCAYVVALVGTRVVVQEVVAPVLL